MKAALLVLGGTLGQVLSAPTSTDASSDEAIERQYKRFNCEPHVCAAQWGNDYVREYFCGATDPSKRDEIMDAMSYKAAAFVAVGDSGGCDDPWTCWKHDREFWADPFCDAAYPAKRNIQGQLLPSTITPLDHSDGDISPSSLLPTEEDSGRSEHDPTILPVDVSPEHSASSLIARVDLPANVPQDFWERTTSPAFDFQEADYLKYEFLHCSAPYDEKNDKVPGECHYLAGSVAKGSEQHLYIRGTRTIIGTCGLSGHIHTWHPDKEWKHTPRAIRVIKNGLCQYYIELYTDFLKISN